jgi:predicted nucleotide-binding protein (sugar kinase/HSP70/actin superfamily)
LLDRFHAELSGFVDHLAALPRKRNPLACPRVIVTGDFFTRFSPFFMEGVRELYNERGIILKSVDLNSLLLYGAYNSVVEAAGGWGLKPGGAALAKACTRIFRPDGKEYLRRWLTYRAERRSEEYYRRIFHKSGLLVASPRDASSLFADASEHISPKIFGEAIPTVGDGVRAEVEGYDGIIIIGPFNSLPFRIAEAILKPHSIRGGMPILTYESDGYAVSPSFLRQVDVHIQQVLDHSARRHLHDAA